MKLIEFIKDENRRKQKKLYSEGLWYQNTYKSLGSSWLKNALSKLELPKNYRFGNFSANAAWYEYDAYISSEKHPTYYVSDINMLNLKDQVRHSDDNFKIINKNQDAKEVTLSMIDNKPLDVILDCKGALWYAINKRQGDCDTLIKTLSTYHNLLNDNGVLLIDWYDDKYWRLKNIAYHFLYNGNKKKNVIKYFGEASTKYYYEELLGNNTKIDFWPMDLTEDNNSYPLQKIMDVAVLSKKEIINLINYIELNRKNIEKIFKRATRTQLSAPIFVDIIIGVLLAAIIVGVVILF